jgi:hypothetical protein
VYLEILVRKVTTYLPSAEWCCLWIGVCADCSGVNICLQITMRKNGLRTNVCNR